MQSFYDPGVRRRAAGTARLEQIAWEAYQEGRKAPRTHKAGPGLRRPGLRPLGRMARDARAHARGGRSGRRCARRASRVLLVCGSLAQRRHLPGRDVQDLAPDADRARGPGRARHRGGPPRPEPAHLGVRPAHPPCKGCVSTAMPLCHWPCSCYPNHADRPDRRLDERDLRALGRGARRDPAHAGVLVPGRQPAQADDRPAGLRRRRQSRSHHHPRQEAAESQGDRAQGLGLSQAPRGPRLRRGGARRRGRHRGRRAARCATGSTGWD